MIKKSKIQNPVPYSEENVKRWAIINVEKANITKIPADAYKIIFEGLEYFGLKFRKDYLFQFNKNYQGHTKIFSTIRDTIWEYIEFKIFLKYAPLTKIKRDLYWKTFSPDLNLVKDFNIQAKNELRYKSKTAGYERWTEYLTKMYIYVTTNRV